MFNPGAGGAAATIADAVADFLRRYPPFGQMEEDALRFLAARLDLGYYPKGTVILGSTQGEPEVFYIIQRGMVQVASLDVVNSDDTHAINLGPGECFSVSAMLEKRPVTASHTAVADTFCYELPATHFPELLDRSVVFHNHATRYLVSLLAQSRKLIQLHSTLSADEQQTMSRTLRSLLTRPPVTCGPDTPVAEVLQTMRNRKIGSMLIVDAGGKPLGIFTRHDVLDRVALSQCNLSLPISAVMTTELRTLSAEASAYEAALLIAHHGIRHVPVLDGQQLIGMVTERDLFALQRVSVRAINRTIASTGSLAELRDVAADIRQLVRNMLGQGVAAEQLTLIISTLNDALVRRILDIEKQKFPLDGIRWCWLAFGSEGRYEQTISTDQDNGLIFDAEDMTAETARVKLLPFAQAVNRDLDACGFPLCIGNIMGGNPQWCLSLDEWRGQFDFWIGNTDPQALLNAVIFFDFRPLHGDESLADLLREHLLGLTQINSHFQRQLAQYALETRPPLGLISDFATEDGGEFKGTLDLKKSGARLFTDAARVLALATGVAHTNTAQRLRQAGPRLRMPEVEVASIVEAFFFLQTLRLRGQLTAGTGSKGANRVMPAQLNEVDRRILKESFRQIRKLQSRLALDYQL